MQRKRDWIGKKSSKGLQPNRKRHSIFPFFQINGAFGVRLCILNTLIDMRSVLLIFDFNRLKKFISIEFPFSSANVIAFFRDNTCKIHYSLFYRMQLRNDNEDDVEKNFEIKSNVLFAHLNAKDIQVFIFTIILDCIHLGIFGIWCESWSLSYAVDSKHLPKIYRCVVFAWQMQFFGWDSSCRERWWRMS